MKAFLAACVVAIVLAAAGAGVLDNLQKPSTQAFTTSGVRL